MWTLEHTFKPQSELPFPSDQWEEQCKTQEERRRAGFWQAYEPIAGENLADQEWCAGLSQAQSVGQGPKSSAAGGDAAFWELDVQVALLYEKDDLICITFRSILPLIPHRPLPM